MRIGHQTAVLRRQRAFHTVCREFNRTRQRRHALGPEYSSDTGRPQHLEQVTDETKPGHIGARDGTKLAQHA